MKLTKLLRAEILDVYEAFWGSLFNVDIEIYTRVLDDNYRLIGTTDEEVFFNKKDAIGFLKATAEQLAGNIERRKSKFKIESVDSLVLITEQFDAYVRIGNNWTFYGRTRVSTLMQQVSNEWKLVQQHFSFPDTKAEEGHTIGLEKIEKENLELRDAIKRRTIELEHKNRELEIEAALERMRVSAMAMHNTDGLYDTAEILYKELSQLGIESSSSGFGIMDEKANSVYFYGINPADGKIIRYANRVPIIKGSKPIQYFFSNWKKQVTSHIIELNKKETLEHETYLAKCALASFKEYGIEDPFTIEDWLAKTAKEVKLHFFNFREGCIYIVRDKRLTDVQQEMVARFTKVFQLTYTRFLDLQKAEAQTREAQIEAALEKVRSRSLAMHKSDELQEVVNTVYERLQELNVEMDSCNIAIFKEDARDFDFWIASPFQKRTASFRIAGDWNFRIIQNLLAARESGQDFFSECFSFEEKNKWFDFAFKHTDFSRLPPERQKHILERKAYALSIAFSKNTGVQINNYSGKLPSEKEKEILIRFSKVFEQAYIRFLDLEKAEAQAREAQIELGLERIRARAMAMQKSDELADAAQLLYLEFGKLGINTFSCGYMFIDEQKNTQTAWVVLPDGSLLPDFIVFPLTGDHVLDSRYKDWKEKKTLHIFEIQGEVNKDHHRFLSNYVPPFVVENIFSRIPDRVVFHCANFSEGYLLILATELFSPEDQQTIIRFARVFEMTYTRFNDLKQAEAQAREAQIELGLERVRARAMAMQKSDELSELVDTVFKELTKLHFTLDRCIIIIIDEKSMSANYWMANPESKTPTSYHVQLKGIPYLDFTFNSWKERKPKVVYDLKGDEKTASVKYIFSKTELKNLPDMVKAGMKNTDRIFLNSSFNNFGCLQADTIEPISEDNLDIIYRFAKVFDLTYTRFNDLQKAEAQAREAQIELGLERVRARAMAMQKSDELSELVDTVFKELTKLDFALTWCIINIIDESTMSNTVWAANPDINKPPESYHMLFEDYPFHHAMMKGWKERNAKAVYVLGGQEKKIYDEYLFSETEFRRVPAEAQAASRAMEKYVVTFSFSNFGGLQTVGDAPLSDANLDILSRFGKVFDLTYTRFNDLKKAEAQTREAEIELALERVRARTMAMQKSDELPEAANLLFLQVQSLGMPAWSAGYCIWEKDKKGITLWMSSEGVMQQPFYAPLTDDPSFIHMREAYERGETFHVEEVGGEELVTHYKYMRTLPVVGEILDSIIAAGHPLPTFQIFHCVYFSQGFLLFITYERVPEAHTIFKRFTNVFEQTFTRFLDLQKAEAQTREAKIEAALEKVRSRTMGMQQSHELGDVATVLFKELNQLVDNLWTCGFVLCEKDRAEDEWWLSTGDGFIPAFYLPNTGDATHANIYDGWKRGETYHTEQLEGEALQEHYDWLMNIPVSKNIFDEMKAAGNSLPSWQKLHCAYFSYGYLVMITQVPCPEEQIFKRFAQVFDQTYTRFLDLQKAEAQAKEAQIEAALERVRSRSMGMQKSEELKEVIKIVYQQIRNLKINLDHAGFVIDYTPGGDWHFWIADEQDIPSKITHPYFESVWANQFNEAKEKGTDLFATHLNFEEKNKFYNELLSYVPGLPETSKEFYLSCPGLAASTVLLENVGLYIENFSGTPYTDEENNTLMRFGKVFQQTYTRFLDLQKAEAQAREAKIETALEKVRSRTMAMQRSDELPETSYILFQQMKELGESAEQLSIGVVHEENNVIEISATLHGGILNKIYWHSIDEPFVMNKVYRAWKTQQKTLIVELKGDQLNAYNKYRNQLTNSEMFPTDFDDEHRRIVYAAFFSKGMLAFAANEPRPPQSLELLERFASVFDLTYTRFLDLQKAEAQAREAQIEAGLERVRAKAMAMHSSKDLAETLTVFYRELKSLGVVPRRCGIAIMDKEERLAEVTTMNTTERGDSIEVIGHIKMSGHKILDDVYENWLLQKEYHAVLRGNEIKEYYQVLKPQMDFPDYPNDVAQYGYYFMFKEGDVYAWTEHELTEDELKIYRRFTTVISLTYKRYKDLQQAEAQAREAQIEASLERVRSKTMAMHNSQDVGNTVATMFDQLVKLGVTTNRCGILIFSNTNNAEVWTAKLNPTGEAALIIGYLDVTIHPMLQSVRHAWENKETTHSYELAADDIKNYYNTINNYPGYPTRFNMDNLPAKEFHSDFFFPEGAVFAFTSEPIAEEAALIFKRFAGVFGQTYRRYLDLQKAEANAREAQIEAGLERVRARTMAMHNSEDVSIATATMFTELEKLGIENFRGGILDIRKNKTQEVWSVNTTPDGRVIRAIGEFDMTLHPFWLQLYTAWENKEELFYYDMSGKLKDDYVRILDARRDYLPNGMPSLPDCHVQGYYFGEGYVWTFTLQPHAEEEKQVMKKFASVFSLTFRRYQDLKKAEAQAKEATIEAALERVRSRAMAMQTSEDVVSATSVLFSELDKLGIKTMRCGILLLDEAQTMEVWTSVFTKDQQVTKIIGRLDMTIHPLLQGIFRSWKQKDEIYSYKLVGDDIQRYYSALAKAYDPYSALAQHNMPDHYCHVYYFEEGGLYTFSEDAHNDETKQVIKRFTSVFSLTFRRYQDLKKAEAQAKDAIKQAALDRIRAEIASMRTTADLERITPLIWNELTILNVPFIRCGVFLMDESQQLIHTFLSTPDGKAIAAFHLPYDTPGNFAEVVNHWHSKQLYIDHWGEPEFISMADTLVKQGAIEKKEQYLNTLPEAGFYLHFLPFLQGMLYVANTTQLANEDLALIQSVADAFSTAYARYEDFNKLEAAKQQVDKTLTDLKQTQQQLVQSEKMASLGELTAGIAHEIQNPLNFVNNFSEVSNELIDEMNAEIEKGNIEEARAIANDIKQNLEKINHHGKRADAIVKGMLQHSRSSSGVKEPTDINLLADEYLRLAYHGLRAKDKSFNATTKTDFDENIGTINVIPQDIGRVILNLFTNAFYVIAEKKKQLQDGYEPTVTVSTKKIADKVLISVKDNGNGIPQKVLDKIFQPFFTTKPTGQGTGLGLSLSYDIVKAHGGELKVETKEGEGSEFIISLPV